MYMSRHVHFYMNLNNCAVEMTNISYLFSFFFVYKCKMYCQEHK